MNVGDLKLSLLLDVKPFGESVKTAMTLLKMFGQSAKDALNFQEPKFSTSSVDAQLTSLESKLNKYSHEVAESSVETEKLASNTDVLNSRFRNTATTTVTFHDNLQNLYLRFQGIQTVLGVLKSSLGGFLTEFNKMQSSMLGLESISVFKGVDPNSSKDVLNNLTLVKDGLLSVSDASTSLKNLLASNFTLEQSVDLLKRLGDSAAFGRQESLSFGDAVRSATEGIKNGNSILVDNAGVTKNLSAMLEEAGFKAQDMSRAGQDAGVRMAIFNGIMNETTGQLGNAGKLMQSSQGALILFEKSMTDLKIAMGSVLSVVVPLITGPLTAISGVIANANANTKTAILIIGSLTAAFWLLNGSLPLPVKLFALLSASVIALPTPIKVLVGTLAILSAYLVAVNTELIMANTLMAGIPLAIGLAVTGATALASAYNDVNGASTDFNQELEKSTDNLNVQSQALSDLQKVQESMHKGLILTKDEQVKYESALSNVKDLYPQVISAIDSKTSKESVQLDVLKDVIKAEQDKLDIQKQAQTNVLTGELADLTQEYLDQADTIENLNNKLRDGAAILKDEFKWNLNPFETFEDHLRSVSDELVKTSSAAGETRQKIVALFLTAIKNNNLAGVLREFKNSLGESKQATEVLDNAVNAMINSLIQGFYNAGLAGQSLAEILRIIAVAQTYIKVGQDMNSDAMIKKGEALLSQINTYLEKIKSAKSNVGSIKTNSEGSDKETGKEQSEEAKDALQQYNEKLEETKNKISEIKNLLAKPGLRPDELEFLLSELARLSAELEKLMGGIDVDAGTVPDVDGKRKPINPDDVPKKIENKTDEILQQSLSLASQISSVLGIGAQTFAGQLLSGLQQGLSLANSFASLLSLILGSGSGGIFGLLGIKFAGGGSVPGTGSGDTVPAMLTPGEFVVKKGVVNKIGTGFFEWLNGGGLFSSIAGKYASGGLVTQQASAPAQVYIINPKLRGNDIELALKRTNKINSRRLT
jgi:hypothetical protein